MAICFVPCKAVTYSIPSNARSNQVSHLLRLANVSDWAFVVSKRPLGLKLWRQRAIYRIDNKVTNDWKKLETMS